jgi:hypothetical protein
VHRPGPGDRRRGRARRAVAGGWLLVRGRGDRPLDAAVDRSRLTLHRSTRRPSLEPGDLAVLYASVWQALFGVVEIAGPPEHEPGRARWGWTVPLRPLVVVGDLDRAPPVEAAGVLPRSIWRHSYIRLDRERLERAVALVEEAAGERLSRPARRGGS